MRVAIIGAGALGSYLGIRLGLAGHAVQFLVRSNAEALRKEGFFLELADGRQLELPSPNVITRSVDLTEADCVLVALKTTASVDTGELIQPAVGSSTQLLTVQNGIGNIEILERAFPGRVAMGGLCQIGVNRTAPGRIRSFVPGDGFMQLGAGTHCDRSTLEAMGGTLEDAGIRIRLANSLGDALWRKLMWNVPFNGLTVTEGGVGTDQICSQPHLRRQARALMEEIRMAAKAQGIEIEASYSDKLLGFTDDLGHYLCSSVLDFKAGKPVEVEAIFRRPLMVARQAGVAAPELERLVDALCRL
jgi:2-dehydropantoate 2-reductase